VFKNRSRYGLALSVKTLVLYFIKKVNQRKFIMQQQQQQTTDNTGKALFQTDFKTFNHISNNSLCSVCCSY